MAASARALQAAIDKYIKGAANETIQQNIILRNLKSRGRIKYGQSGLNLAWRAKYKQRGLDGVADMEAVQFARQNLYRSFSLPWRNYRMQDAISRQDREMVKGNEALIQIWPGKMQDMMEDANDRLNAEMFVDGNATGNEKKVHGLESIFGGTGTSTAQYGTSSETYGGQAMSAIHGTESDTTAYSPHLVQEDYTGFGSWGSNPTKIARSLISACTVKNTRAGSPDMLLTTESRYLEFKDKLASEERYVLSPEVKDLAAGMRGLSYDGVMATWDFDCTASCTYCLNFDKIEMRVLTPRLWYSEASYDHSRDAYPFSVGFLGNLRLLARYQGKSGDFS